jgi:amino acid adenylation domain-containing protein
LQWKIEALPQGPPQDLYIGDDMVSMMTIGAAFDAIVAKHEEKIAVRNQGQIFTYGDILRYANELAAHLNTYDLSPEDSIAIWGGRSVEFVVAALAILKVGCAYVPLDVASSEARIIGMLDASNARLAIITTREESAQFPVAGDIDCELKIRTTKALMSFDLMKLAHKPTNDDFGLVAESPLAFIMFTSGSSGRPKGVLIEHRSVLSLVDGLGDYVVISTEHTMLNFSRTTFDAATFEIWGALLNGASLAIYPEVDLNMQEFASFLRDHKVDTAWLTAGLFHEIMIMDSSALHPINQLVVGGDIVSPRAFNAFLTARNGRTIINAYGPTEATTFSTKFVATEPVDDDTSVPIGSAIRGVKTYILSSEGEEVIQGNSGELHIAGVGLGRGYVGDYRRDRYYVRSSLDGINERMYATGDFVRERTDGMIEYLGRDHDQITVDGFRVVLSDIERCLEQMPSIEQALAIIRKDRVADGEIVAVVLFRGHRKNLLRKMRTYLQSRLPKHMIPSRFFITDRIPLNRNGKVDRYVLQQGWGDDLVN